MGYQLTGMALLDTGAPASNVVVRDWGTHAHVAAVVPAGDGSWAVTTASAGPFDATFMGPPGYQPVTHGPVAAQVVP